MTTSVRVPGYCPMGCGQTLFTAVDGHITCSFITCPDPAAVDTILEDRESEHVVTMTETAFTVKHPLKERINDALLTCELHARIAALGGPPVIPGTYRVLYPTGSWSWQLIPQEAS